MTHAKIIGIAPTLAVSDVRRTVEYYKVALGFTNLGLVGDPPVYGMVARDGFQVHFVHTDTGMIHRNHELRTISYDLILWVPEIDIFYGELKSKSVHILQEITLKPYGSREFLLEDCDGHRILVGD